MLGLRLLTSKRNWPSCIFGLRPLVEFSGRNYSRSSNPDLAEPFAPGRATTGEQLRIRATDHVRGNECGSRIQAIKEQRDIKKEKEGAERCEDLINRV